MSSYPHNENGLPVTPGANGAAVQPNAHGGPTQIRWYDPPLPVEEPDQLERGTSEMLAQLKELLPTIPVRAWELLYSYRTRAVNASRERQRLQEAARHELDEHNRRLRAKRFALTSEVADVEAEAVPLEDKLAAVKQQFGDAAARAGLVCNPEEASPEEVERALVQAAPTSAELAGGDGAVPPERTEAAGNGESRKKWFEWLAAGVSGFMLALCLGTLVGLLSFADIQRPERFPRLFLAGLMGLVLVAVTGEFVGYAWRSLARALAEGRQDRPRLRAALSIALMLVALTCAVGAAEITGEAYGLRALHLQQHQQERRLNRKAESPVLPLWAYGLLGMLITCPYLMRKAAKAWSESETAQQDAWQQHQRRQWVDARRQGVMVQRASALSSEVVRLKRLLEQFAARRDGLLRQREALQERTELTPEMQARLQTAQEAALGAAAEFHAKVRELVELHEPLSGIAPTRTAITPARPPEAT
jgi:hypothetical protein